MLHRNSTSLEDHKEYVCVSSTDSKGVPVRIYANKPDHHDDGLEAINRTVASTQGLGKPAFQVFIGRGHSYHADEYLPLITPDVKLVHLGSCGGFQNLSKVLKTSPSAQVISTQQTGSMYVNDPLLFSINESIRTTGTPNWIKQQKTLDSLSSSNKDAYLLPHKNIPAMMQTGYAEVGQRRSEINAPDKIATYIKDRMTFSMNPFHLSNGKIDTDEMAKIIKDAQQLGKGVKVVQNNDDNDKIIISDAKYIKTYKVKLADDVKSR
jgi:hypothetical protein